MLIDEVYTITNLRSSYKILKVSSNSDKFLKFKKKEIKRYR